MRYAAVHSLIVSSRAPAAGQGRLSRKSADRKVWRRPRRSSSSFLCHHGRRSGTCPAEIGSTDNVRLYSIEPALATNNGLIGPGHGTIDLYCTVLDRYGSSSALSPPEGQDLQDLQDDGCLYHEYRTCALPIPCPMRHYGLDMAAYNQHNSWHHAGQLWSSVVKCGQV